MVRDNEVKAAMLAMNVYCQSFNGDVMVEPWEVLNAQGLPFTNFTDYWARRASDEPCSLCCCRFSSAGARLSLCCPRQGPAVLGSDSAHRLYAVPSEVETISARARLWRDAGPRTCRQQCCCPRQQPCRRCRLACTAWIWSSLA